MARTLFRYPLGRSARLYWTVVRGGFAPARSGQSAYMVSFDARRKDRELVVEIGGDLDWDAVLTIEPRLEEATGDPDLESLTLDLSGLTFIDSSGIGLLISTVERCRAEDVEVRIVKPEQHVFHVFEVVGLADVLPFIDGAATS
jgi:anti-sigma B factor antagonist